MGVGNLLGQPFYKYVNKQVEVRQKLHLIEEMPPITNI